MLSELARREKEHKIHPDPDIDAYMKVSLNLYYGILNYHLWNLITQRETNSLVFDLFISLGFCR